MNDDDKRQCISEWYCTDYSTCRLNSHFVDLEELHRMGAIKEVIIDSEPFGLIVECWNKSHNSHSVKKMNINTVNMICDFIDYLIKFNINVSINVEKRHFLRIQHYTTNDQNLVDKSQIHSADVVLMAVEGKSFNVYLF